MKLPEYASPALRAHILSVYYLAVMAGEDARIYINTPDVRSLDVAEATDAELWQVYREVRKLQGAVSGTVDDDIVGSLLWNEEDWEELGSYFTCGLVVIRHEWERRGCPPEPC